MKAEGLTKNNEIINDLPLTLRLGHIAVRLLFWVMRVF
jgi:hypothetical protein